MAKPHRSAPAARSLLLLVALALVFLGIPVQLALATVPTATLNVPAQGFIGEPISFTVTFDNTHPTNTGYGPYVDLILPTIGVDGAGAAIDDGITFGSATYLGVPVNSTMLTFDALGQAIHPYTGATIVGTPGNQLVVLELPFGSFTPGQPPATIDVTTTLSNLADLGTGLNISATGGFRYGSDPLDNPIPDPPIVGVTDTATFTPTLVTLEKIYIGPEDETATGPNFPRQYTISIDVANGQTITDFDVTDLLPDNLAFLSVDSIVPAGSVTTTPPVGVPASPNPLVVNIPSVTGGAGSGDVQITFSYFIPRVDAFGNPIINANNGNDVVSNNEASALGDWTPIDTRDAGGIDNVSVAPSGFEHVLTDKSIAIQKGVTNLTDASNSPGDVLQYTLTFQISDFFTFQNIGITDVLSDGQRFDATFTPTMSINGNPFVLGVAGMNAANFNVVVNSPGTGTSTLTFDVSDEMITRGQNGTLLGGCVPVGGTGGPAPDCALYNNAGTTGTIVYRAVIQEFFTDTFPSGDPSVDQGDVLDNDVVILGDILSNDFLAPTGFDEADDSGANVTIATGTLAKSIYALNGVVCAPCSNVQVAPGDTVTYRLNYSLPNSDIEDLVLTDYLPLPVFDATLVTTFNDVISAVAPVSGQAQFGPADTFRPLSGIVPTMTTNATSNRITFTYGDFDAVGSPSTLIDLLFTVTVESDPFADGLFLTNQLHSDEGTTNSGPGIQDAIVQIQLTEPVLNIRKGVIGTDNPGGTFSPTNTGLSGVTVPSAACPRFTPTKNSTNLASAPIDSDLTGVDAGDLVSFAIVLENTGSGLRGAFDVRIRDTLPTGFAIPGGGLNLCVTNGAGTAIPFTTIGSGLFDAAGGIELTDPGPLDGALDAFHASNGLNIAIVTYDLTVTGSVGPLEDLINTTTLTNFAGTDGGPDHTTTDPTDTATVTTVPPAPVKSIVSTSETHTADPAPDTTANPRLLAIGEIVRYRMQITIAEGTSSNLRLIDTLPTGLSLINDGTVTVSFTADNDITESADLAGADNDAVPPTFALPVARISTAGQVVTYTLGNLVNNDNDSNAETVTVEFNALVNNDASNNNGDAKDNTFTVEVGGVNRGTSNTVSARIVEPTLTVTKTANPVTGDAGDTITFTVVAANPAGGPTSAFEARVLDTLPADYTLNLGSVSVAFAGGAAGSTNASAGNTVDVTIGSIPPGGSATVTYTATLNINVTPGQVVNNTATLTYTSLPGTGTTGNPTGSNTPGASGAGDGERDGTGGVNDYTTSDPASVTINNVVPTKQLLATSEAHTGNVAGVERVAIGEIVRYRLLVQLPEGSTTNLQIRDNLPGGLTFLNDNTAMVAFVSNGGGITSSTLNSGLPGCAGLNLTGAAGTVTPTCPLPDTAVSSLTGSNNDTYATGTDVFFKFGDVINGDSDADAEFVVVAFNVLVDNTVAGSNDAGDNRNNTFDVFINGTQNGPTSNSLQVRVREPAITNTAKVVFTPASATGDAGDVITYRVTYSNANGVNNTTAFEARILDTLPADVTLNVGSITVTLGGGAAGVTDNSAGNTVDVTIGTVPAGGTVQIDYSATLNYTVTPGQVVNNTANLTYTSLPGTGTTGNPTGSNTPGGSGATNGERDGSGGINDYTGSEPASVTVNNIAPIKAIAATSEAHTTGASLAIGEIVRYRLQLVLPEGTSPNLVLTDTLPAGLQFINDGTVLLSFTATNDVTESADLAGADNDAVPPTFALPAARLGVAGQTLTFSLGDLTNNDSDAAAENVTLEFNALVLNDATTNNGGTLNNNFSVTVGASAPITSNTVTATIVEPTLTIAKTANPVTGDAGDTITFTVVVSNPAGGATSAFDSRVLDTLVADYTLNLGSVGVAFAGGAAGSTNASAGNTLDVTIGSIPPGGSATITYTAVLNTTVTPGQVITNTANLTYTSLPGTGTTGNPTGSDTPGASGAGDGERDGSGGINDYTGSDPAQVTVNTVNNLTKSIVATSEAHTTGTSLAVGEIVRYRLQVGVIEGTTTNLQISDALPAGLRFIDDGTATLNFTADTGITSSTLGGCPCPITLPGGAISGGPFADGTDPIFSLGNLVNADNDAGDEFAVVEFNALVLNNANTNNADSKDNTFSVTINGTGAGTSNTVTATIVEPNLQVVKTANPVNADAGDTITFTVVVSHTGTSATTAFDTHIFDTLPADYTLNVGSVNVVLAGGAAGTTDASAGNTVDVTIGTLPVGGTVTMTYTASVNFTVTPGQVVTNTANVTYTSLLGTGTTGNPTGSDTPGASGAGDGERDGTGGVNDYTTSDPATVTVDTSTPIKRIVATSEGHTGESTADTTADPRPLAVGEIVRYQFQIVLPEGTSPNIVITDTLPNGLSLIQDATMRISFVANNDVTEPADLSGADNDANPPTFSLPLARVGLVGQDMTINLGTLINNDSDPANTEFVLLEFNALVTNTAANNNGDPKDNAFSLSINGVNQGTSTTVSAVIVEPELLVDKVAAPITANPSDLITFTVNVTHTANSDAAAFDTFVTDTLPTGYTLNLASVTTTPAGGAAGISNTSAGNTVNITVDTIPLGGSVQITYTATVNFTVTPGQVMTNTATLTYTSLPDEGTTGNPTGSDTPGNSGDPDGERNGTGGVNDHTDMDDATVTILEPDLSIVKTHAGNFTVGQNGVFTLTVTNIGPGYATGAVTVVDTLPAELTFVSATGNSWTCGAVGQVVTCTHPGPVAPGVTLPAITLTVNPNTAVGSPFLNIATVSTPGETILGNNSDDDPVIVTPAPEPDLTIVKTHAGNFTVGSNGSFTLTVTNVGTAPTTGLITVTDTLPPQLDFVSATGGGWTCNFANPVVSCTHNGPLAIGASLPVITLTVNPNTAVGSPFTNTATVTTPGDNNPTNDTDSDDVNVLAGPSPDVTILKTHTGNFTVGSNGSFVLAVSNVGSAPTTGAVTVTDTLPVELTFVSATGAGWTCSFAAPTVTCTYPSNGVGMPLAVGASLPNITLTVSPNTAVGSPFTNTATVTTPGDTNPTNNTDTDSVIVTTTAEPDLTILKTHTGNFIVGTNGTFTLRVTNVGTAPATGLITVTDTLPVELTFVSATGTGWTCNFAAPTLTCTRNGPLAVGASAPNITLTVNPNTAIGSPFTNTATVSVPGDTNPSNDTDSDDVIVTASAEPDLTILKTHTGNFIVGTNGTFTLRVTNVGSAATTGQITVTDTLPVELTFISAAGTGWTCGFAAPIVTCTHNGPLAVGASLPNITLTVNPNTAVGSPFTNLATVTTPGDNNPANNTDSDDVTVAASASPDLTIVKSHVGDFVLGVNHFFSLTVTNIGPVPTTGLITVTDTVPPELTFVSAAGTGWTCNFAIPTLTCTHNGPVGAGANLPLITLTVNANATGTFVNTVSVTTPGDINPTNDDDTDNVTVVATGAPDLTILKSHTGNFTVGLQGTYQLLVTNVGSTTTTGTITVTDTLQTGLTLVSATGTGWTCGAVGQVVTCTHPGPLNVGSSLPPIVLVVDVGALALGVFNNTGIVSTPGDINPANDSDDDQTIVNGPNLFDPPLVRKTVNAAGFPELEWRIFMINSTNPPASNLAVRLVDPIPTGTTYVIGSVNCVAQGASVVTLCQFDAVNNQIVLEAIVEADPGATTEAQAANEVVVTFRTSVLPGITQANNVARLFWDADGDGDVNDNVAAGQTPLLADAQWQQASAGGTSGGAAGSLADLYIAKQVDPPFALPGERVTWTILVTNPSPVAVTNVLVQDTLPDRLKILSVAASSGSVTFAGQVVTFSQPSLNPGETVTITVVTEIAKTAQPPFVLTNNACVTITELPNQRCAQASVVSAASLPQTGASPYSGMRSWLLLAVSAGVVLWKAVRWVRRA